jgi:hypothetical protein
VTCYSAFGQHGALLIVRYVFYLKISAVTDCIADVVLAFTHRPSGVAVS